MRVPASTRLLASEAITSEGAPAAAPPPVHHDGRYGYMADGYVSLLPLRLDPGSPPPPPHQKAPFHTALHTFLLLPPRPRLASPSLPFLLPAVTFSPPHSTRCAGTEQLGGQEVRACLGEVEMERYEVIKDIGSGNFGVAKLVRDQICHRDLKLENTLLDGSIAPRLKICDFGYSKSSVLHSQPKSTVGTPAYIAPEVFSRKEYNGKVADVWSCGVTLFVMLVGAYPFEDPDKPRNFRKTITRILSVQYAVPDYVRVSMECRHLLSRVFVASPEQRITIPEIKNHPWFLKNLPIEMTDEYQMSLQMNDINAPLQSLDEIMSIIQEAQKPGDGSKFSGQIPGLGSMELDDIDADDIDIEDSGDFVCAL
ncbi:hypothetical protein ABZP36_002236 [Zizania latifolia]